MEKKYANMFGYSDIEPYEVVRRVTEKTIEIRAMDSVLDPACKKELADSFVPGGFSGHTDNSLQCWIITSNESNPVSRIRLHKDGYWYGNYGKFRLADKPIKHYDYNF